MDHQAAGRRVRGGEFACPDGNSPLQLVRNLENAFSSAGFSTVFKHKDGNFLHYYTGKKGTQWVHAATAHGNDISTYKLTVIRVKETQQEPRAKAAPKGGDTRPLVPLHSDSARNGQKR